jgi:hypothetical protein
MWVSMSYPNAAATSVTAPMTRSSPPVGAIACSAPVISSSVARAASVLVVLQADS